MTRDQIISTDKAITVWLEGPISEQESLETFEQTLLESKKFQRYDIGQVKLLNKRIILKSGK